MTDGKVLCDVIEVCCRCREEKGHEMPHRCPCGGAWTTDADGNFEDMVALPPPYPVEGLGSGDVW